MSAREQGDKRESPFWLFPEIIGVSAIALAAPVWLIKIWVAGYVVTSVAGVALWLSGVSLMVRFILRRQYFLAYLSMIPLFCLFYMIHRALP
jgi:hypothetical protein